MSLRMSAMMFALSLWARMASSECFCIDSSSLAGWPSLRIFALQRANLSTKLSTATLDGAQHRTCTNTQISKWSCLYWSTEWRWQVFGTELSSGRKIFINTNEFCTFWPCLTACRIISTTVVVFPVPGGPWITASSLWDRAKDTASLWESSRFVFKNLTSSDETKQEQPQLVFVLYDSWWLAWFKFLCKQYAGYYEE